MSFIRGGELNHFHSEECGANSDEGGTKNTTYIALLKKAAVFAVHQFFFSCWALLSSPSGGGRGLITIWWVWEQSCRATSWKLVIGFWSWRYNSVLVVFNVSVQMVWSLEVIGGGGREALCWRSLIVLYLFAGVEFCGWTQLDKTMGNIHQPDKRKWC